jgi:hypothetical protein
MKKKRKAFYKALAKVFRRMGKGKRITKFPKAVRKALG